MNEIRFGDTQVDDLSPISPADWGFDKAAHLLVRAGFTTPEMFYAAFTFRGWVAHRKEP